MAALPDRSRHWYLTLSDVEYSVINCEEITAKPTYLCKLIPGRQQPFGLDQLRI